MLTGIAFVGVVPQESRVVERAADKLYLLASVIPPSLCHTWTAILAVLSHKIFVWWYDALCAPERAIETKCLLGEIFSYCHITMQLYRPSPCARGYPEPHWCFHKCKLKAKLPHLQHQIWAPSLSCVQVVMKSTLFLTIKGICNIPILADLYSEYLIQSMSCWIKNFSNLVSPIASFCCGKGPSHLTCWSENHWSIPEVKILITKGHVYLSCCIGVKMSFPTFVLSSMGWSDNLRCDQCPHWIFRIAGENGCQCVSHTSSIAS